MRAKRGRCVNCDARRVLYGGICRDCMDEEEFGRQLDQTLKAARLMSETHQAGQRHPEKEPPSDDEFYPALLRAM